MTSRHLRYETTYVEPIPTSLPFSIVGQRVLCEWPEEGTDVPVDVTVGQLCVGSFRCLRDNNDDRVFVVEGVGQEPVVAFDVSIALKAHLGLVQTKTVDGIPTLIWPDGSAHDLY